MIITIKTLDEVHSRIWIPSAQPLSVKFHIVALDEGDLSSFMSSPSIATLLKYLEDGSFLDRHPDAFILSL